MAQYNKPAFNTAQHLQQWQQRGLLIPDMDRAERYLSNISYYRLSTYSIPYCQAPAQAHQFRANTSFDDIFALQTLLYTISPSSHWAQRLQELMQRYPRVSLAHMGMPVNWAADPFWQDALHA
ncbi:Abi family protein [Massilia sp. BHUDP2]|uniref:Abi family protein n=1 Tax=Massilia sp. BHUDP2 TaxID=3034505 RepID=UPI0039063E91